MVVYPVSGGKFFNVLAGKYTPGSGTVYDGPWSGPTTGQAVAKEFEGWDPRALAMINVRLLVCCLASRTAMRVSGALTSIIYRRR